MKGASDVPRGEECESIGNTAGPPWLGPVRERRPGRGPGRLGPGERHLVRHGRRSSCFARPGPSPGPGPEPCQPTDQIDPKDTKEITEVATSAANNNPEIGRKPAEARKLVGA